ncbi:hypothetical protein TNCV_14331 [Trichonephila clavipes]|nr:hypothetical protein TNCV_14331 [Trichonephila clavipes]
MLWGCKVAGRNYPPTNKNTLIRALTEEWDKLPQQLLDNVVQSMELKRVAWSDESRIQILNADGRLRIGRQANEAIDPVCQEKEYNINSKYAKLDNFLTSASSSSCASASCSNARELDEQILEVKINPQEKNTVSDTSTNKDILHLMKRSRKMKTKKQN